MLSHTLLAQDVMLVSGTILDARSKKPLEDVTVSIEGTQTSTLTEISGQFQLSIANEGEYIVNVAVKDFITKRLPTDIENQDLELGTIYLERDISVEHTDNLITLTDSELLDDEVNSNSAALLQATRDVFLNRAAFDFGQAFFRVRGYDSQNGQVMINGIVMNKFFDGRPQWNNWGGLNDVTRNQQFQNGLEASDFTFGGILGNTNIDTRPSGLRPGTRLSASASNRTYAGRLMTTFNSGLQKNRWAYSVSASRRWAKQGHIDGTLYDALSLFGAVEYQFNANHSLNFTGIFASNRRGRSSAITEEVFELVGKKYNPYWGIQNGKIRNSRERKIAEPILMMNHFYESERLQLNTGIAYQLGTNARSRLGYYNAPNPDPSYYRYLPSYYINSSIGANFVNAQLAKEGFLNHPQLDWQNIYTANSGEKAAYVLYDDVSDDVQITMNMIGNWTMNSRLQVDFGLAHKSLVSDNYSMIDDLFGAD
ncbi:MAG: TonB-dependent receptor, partial [Pricia sp.]|nr:TonB-dependent receptor [Pricia sp.]